MYYAVYVGNMVRWIALHGSSKLEGYHKWMNRQLSSGNTAPELAGALMCHRNGRWNIDGDVRNAMGLTTACMSSREWSGVAPVLAVQQISGLRHSCALLFHCSLYTVYGACDWTPVLLLQAVADGCLVCMFYHPLISSVVSVVTAETLKSVLWCVQLD